MTRILQEINQTDGVLIHPPPPVSLSLTPYYSVPQSTPSSSSALSKISPVLLLIIAILALIVFISGLLHLLFRFLIKRPSFSTIYQSNRYPQTSTSQTLQRQLQHLFRLHDSGLDQVSIDALPVFCYKDIVGLKEPFDCAVCLCEFSDRDKLRLLPACSHAFHIDCIDTWLLSNSSCPLCRGTLSSSGLLVEIPLLDLQISGETQNGVSIDGENTLSSGHNTVIKEDKSSNSKRVFSVRLGKFRSLNESGKNGGEIGNGESSRCNLDGRRCYSMGRFQYIVGDYSLEVTLNDLKLVKGREGDEVEGKRISGRSRGDSFSVSKTWLWSKNKRFPSSANTPKVALSFSPSSSSSSPIMTPPNNDITQKGINMV